MHRNLGYAGYFYRPINATAAGTTTINGSSLDLVGAFGAPFDSIMYILLMGTLTATQATVLKIQGSNDNATWVDLATTHQGPPADADSNKLMLTDVYRVLGYRYVRPVVVRGTANAVIDGVIGIGYNAHSLPITTQDSTVSTPTSSGASATPIPVNVTFDVTNGTA